MVGVVGVSERRSEPLGDCKDVARLLNMKEKSVYTVPFPAGIVVKVGRLKRFRMDRLREWIEAGGNACK